jgi:hypothetical protein
VELVTSRERPAQEYKNIAWLAVKSVFNRGYRPLLHPMSGILKIYGPSVHRAIIGK